MSEWERKSKANTLNQKTECLYIVAKGGKKMVFVSEIYMAYGEMSAVNMLAFSRLKCLMKTVIFGGANRNCCGEWY